MSWRGRLECLTSSVLNPDAPIILMYHRVARLANDPWALAVSPENFREHVRILSEERNVVPLGTLIDEARNGRGKGMAAITFDDGYVDVVENALPILSEFGCPATTFLITGALGRKRGFWWDELTSIVFEATNLPPMLSMRIPGSNFTWRGPDTSGTEPPRALVRKSLYYALWSRLRAMTEQERDQCLGSLAEWAGVPTDGNATSWPMTAEQAARMAAGGLMDIGAHSRSHPSLTILDRDGQRREMSCSRKVCEDLVGGKIDLFAYPFGHFNETSVELAAEGGFGAGLTTKAGTVNSGSNPFTLPRLNIGDYSARGFRAALAMNFAMPSTIPLNLSAGWA